MSIEEKLDVLFVKAFMSNPCPMAISEMGSGRYIIINHALLQTLGYLKTEVIGKSSKELNIFSYQTDRDNAIQVLQEYGYLRNFEANIRCKNGSIIIGSFNAEYIKIENETFLLTIMNDITAKKLLEQEVIRLEKLNLIGQLAGGISHEVRNPMTTVRGFLQHLAKKSQHIRHQEKFELLISELDRANAIITNFLSISKTDPADNKHHKISLNEFLNKVKLLIESDARESNHQINYHIDENCFIIGNESEIRQLILNLVRNGFDAMPSGGTLSLKTLRKDNHVILEVQDQGKGIDKSILNKIGTPFFTTKDNGTGLGLAVCFGIAHRHNAKINIDTSSSGTTFAVDFPVS